VAARRLPDVDAAKNSYFGGSADVETVSADELTRRMAAGEVTLLDVRPTTEYAAGHLPGAINIPVDELADRLAELPAGTDVVAYCRGPYCVFAHDAVRLLHAHGRTAVRLGEGVTEWRIARQRVTA
jgi:rhodanese-related sulfurtransferase